MLLQPTLFNEINVDRFASLKAACEDSETLGKSIVIASPVVVAESFETTRAIVIKPGGLISISSGITLTISGPFSCGLFQCFSGAGSVTGLTEARPEWFGAKGTGLVDDSAAILAAAKSTIGSVIGNPLSTYSIQSLTLTSASKYKDLNFVPYTGYVGDGPKFTIPASGILTHENVTVRNFPIAGAAILRGSYSGTPSFRTVGLCAYEDNGVLTRTLITSALNTSTTFVIPVTAGTGTLFSAGNVVWINDGQFTVLSATADSVTLVNNGTSATLLSGGHNDNPVGQYITKDKAGYNGLTIGDGNAAFNVDIGENTSFQRNAWFGLFHWANTAAADQILKVSKSILSNNGFIGLGMGVNYVADAQGNQIVGNGNNGMDVYKVIKTFTAKSNELHRNGTDGIFVGVNGGDVDVSSNISTDNMRMGVLLNGWDNNTTDCRVYNNDLRNNYLRSLTSTAVLTPQIIGNSVGVTSVSDSIFIEGRNGTANPKNSVIKYNYFYTNIGAGNDIGGNVGGYTSGGDNGAVHLLGNTFESGAKKVSVGNINTHLSTFFPSSYSAIDGAVTRTAAAGSTIAVRLYFYAPYATSALSLPPVQVSYFVTTDEAGMSAGAVTTVTLISGTALSTEVSGGTAMSNFGESAWNFALSTAGTRYLQFTVEGVRHVVKLIWT